MDTGSSQGLRAETIEGALRKRVVEALGADRVALAFQPVVCAADPGKPAFFEGLARLVDPRGRIVPAAEFVGAIEESDFSRQLDCAALQLGLAEMRACPGLRLSVNLSARTIGCPEWVEILDRALDADPTLGERLIIEITERSAMDMPGCVRGFMRALQLRGIAFALDDFGAGQTSFRHLRDFRFDMVKLDGQFSRNIARDPDHRVFVTALVGIARHFEMLTVAEHVASDEDAACLADLGVDCLQGYHFGHPELAPYWSDGAQRQQA